MFPVSSLACLLLCLKLDLPPSFVWYYYSRGFFVIAVSTRCQTDVLVAISGEPDQDTPVSAEGILRWVTSSQQARDRLMPLLARTDYSVARTDGKTPDRNPEHLDFVLRESFEGRCWYQYVVDHARSRAAFTLRLGAIFARAGISVTCDESWLSPQELKAERVRFAETDIVIARAEAARMAANVPEALTRYANAKPFFQHFATEDEQAGQQALELMNLFEVPHRAPPDDNWFWFYTRHRAAFAAYKALVTKTLRYPVHAVLATPMASQQVLFVAEVLQVLLGVEASATLSGTLVLKDPFTLSPAQLTWLRDRAKDFQAHDFKNHRRAYTKKSCQRWSGLAKAAKRSGGDPIARKELVKFLTPALKTIGLVLKAWTRRTPPRG